MVTISADTVEETAKIKERHDLGMKMLSDPELQVIDEYNLRHQDAITLTPDRGMVRAIGIPTTFLFGTSGRLLYYDQVENYRERQDVDILLDDVKEVLEDEN